MDLKYRENRIWKTNSMLWYGMSFLNIICLFFLFGMEIHFFTIIILLIMSGNIILSISIGTFYLRLSDITYIQLENDMLLVHQGHIRYKKKINYEDIEESRISDNKLILILSNGKEIEINLALLKIKDFDRLNIKLSEHVELRELN